MKKIIILAALLVAAFSNANAATILEADIDCDPYTCTGYAYDYASDTYIPWITINNNYSNNHQTYGAVLSHAELTTGVSFDGIPLSTRFSGLGGRLDTAEAALPGKVPNSRTINSHALTADVTVTKSDVSLGNVANVDTSNASNISSGTLNVARLPASIDAVNMGGGSVSNTELSYVDGVTSAIQTQMNAKAAASSLSTVATSGSYNDLANKPTIPTVNSWTSSTDTRTIQTGTGAVGWQLSSSQNATVSYSIKISVTATIGSNAEGYIAAEVAPTNSATAGDWVECGRFSNGQTITLAIALQSVQPIGGEVSCDVPSGYYVKLRQVTVSGSPAFTFISGYKVLK